MGMENQNQPVQNPVKKSIWSNHLFIKPLFIGVLVLLLLIPMTMIESVILERQRTSESATREVQQKYSGEQTIYSPVITIPVIEESTYAYVPSAVKTEAEVAVMEVPAEETPVAAASVKKRRTKRVVHILPETLKINGNITTKELKRGMYEVVVYSGPIEIEGTFKLPKKIFETGNPILDKARINMGISDLRGIKEQLNLQLGDSVYKLGSGLHDCNMFGSGASSPIVLDADTLDLHFKVSVCLNGSSNLSFVPLGETTEVSLKSNCSTPSFMGTFLPETRTVTDTGFVANWKVLNLNRNYAQIIYGDEAMYPVSSSAFGVDVLTPVQHYQKSMRSAKYAMLIILLTFVISFFVEIIQKKNIHPFQYLLVGLALCLFYSLLISLSEHIGFFPAYLIASIMTVSMLTCYLGGVLKVWKTARLIGGLLLVLYAYVFVLIQMETYALLAGSLGLFIILSIIMYVSQRINWSSPEQEK